MSAYGHDAAVNEAHSTTLASDILRQLERTRAIAGANAERDARRRETAGAKRRRRGDPREENDDDDASAQLASERRLQRRPAFASEVKLRPNVSMLDHLERLVFVLRWCDMYERGSWFGVKRFIDCYFSLVFKPYLGPVYKLNIIHVAKMRKVCGVCIISHEEKLCTLLIMLNYPLWDRLLQVASSLPSRYFRKSARQRATSGDEQQPRPGRAAADEENNTEAYNVSLAALCLVERLEASMRQDLNFAHLGHVVGVTNFFANSRDAHQLFRTDLVFE